MEALAYLENMKKMQAALIEFIDDANNIEENYQNFISAIEDLKIKSHRHDFKLLTKIFSNIIQNHHVSPIFYDQIEKILLYFKEELTQYLSNNEIIDIFKGNKRILLFLFDEQIARIDEYAFQVITSPKYKARKYNKFFFSEIKQFLSNIVISNLKIPRDYDEKRGSLSEQDMVLKIIQNDNLDEFIKKKISISMQRKITIFETNFFLCKKEKISLIEYAAFYGSIEIFKYLLEKGQKVNTDIWIPAIHGNNLDLIKILENNDIKPNKALSKKLLKESIKCHHDEITNYILNNYLPNNETRNLNEWALKYYNFLAFQNNFENETIFPQLCKYDYYSFVEILMKTKNININAIIEENNTKIIINFI